MIKRSQLHYFMIAIGIIILIRAMFIFYTESVLQLLLDIFIAIALLTNNVPRVINLPIGYCYYIRKAEYISLVLVVCLFICVIAERCLVYGG